MLMCAVGGTDKTASGRCMAGMAAPPSPVSELVISTWAKAQLPCFTLVSKAVMVSFCVAPGARLKDGGDRLTARPVLASLTLTLYVTLALTNALVTVRVQVQFCAQPLLARLARLRVVRSPPLLGFAAA